MKLPMSDGDKVCDGDCCCFLRFECVCVLNYRENEKRKGIKKRKKVRGLEEGI